jgi:hypothetical protein
LFVTYQPNRQAEFSGQLANPSGPMANRTVNLTGVVNASVTTNQQGHYDVILAVPQLGTAYAASGDGQSNTAQFTLVNGSPVINDFTAVSVGNGMWLFSGSVSGAPTQGETVNFGGITPLQGQSTAVNGDGTFSFYAMVPSGEGGWASAVAIDWWNDTSETAVDYVNA